jgi:hypothetical protein
LDFHYLREFCFLFLEEYLTAIDVTLYLRHWQDSMALWALGVELLRFLRQVLLYLERFKLIPALGAVHLSVVGVDPLLDAVDAEDVFGVGLAVGHMRVGHELQTDAA